MRWLRPPSQYKDEHQINTLFHDVYLMAKDCKAPFPYVLVIKRSESDGLSSVVGARARLTRADEPAKTFENPDEYMHVFSSDEGTLHRLANAIYDSKVSPHAVMPPFVTTSADVEPRASTWQTRIRAFWSIPTNVVESPGAWFDHPLLHLRDIPRGPRTSRSSTMFRAKRRRRGSRVKVCSQGAAGPSSSVSLWIFRPLSASALAIIQSRHHCIIKLSFSCGCICIVWSARGLPCHEQDGGGPALVTLQKQSRPD